MQQSREICKGKGRQPMSQVKNYNVYQQLTHKAQEDLPMQKNINKCLQLSLDLESDM